jgi:hypothetical protein
MKNLLITLVCVVGMITASYSQFTTATYGQWPTTTYTPAADDSWEYIVTDAYSGEYSVIAVTSGQHYQFLTYRSANGAARYLTITDEFDTPIISGTTTSLFADTIGWTATFTGNIKFFTHTNSGCGTSTQNSTRAIRGVVPPPPPPSNDDPSGAIQLFVNDAGGYGTYSNTSSTNTLTESTPSCASYNGEDVWFYVDVPAGVNVLDIDTQTGDITDAGMTIYRGTIGSLTEIECDDDDALDGLMPWIYREDFTPGERIYIRVWEYGGGTTGTFNIFVSTPQALPVELVSFDGNEMNHINHLEWTTASEANSDIFEIEWSTDAIDWWLIGDVKAAGNSNTNNYYSFNHEDFRKGTFNYYRLKQIDYDGNYKIYGPIAINNRTIEKRVIKYVNSMGQEVNPLTTTGLVLIVFEDGSTSKLIR